MKTRVGSTAEAHRLVLVLQVILDMPHLMVDSEELFHRHCGALLNPIRDEKYINFLANNLLLHKCPIVYLKSLRL